MKKSLILSAVMLAGAAMSSCDDNDYMELDKGNTPLEVTPSVTTLALDEARYGSDALTIKWTSGTNHGTGARITYTLTASDEANPSNVVEIKSNIVNSMKWSATNEKLNDLLLNDLHLIADVEANVKFAVIADVYGEEEPQIASAVVALTPYKPVTTTLYLIGPATQGGWSADAVTEMASTERGQFTYTGNMHAGDFHFVTTKGQFAPAYANVGGRAVLIEDESAQMDNWSLDKAGCYKIDVNLFTGEVKIAESEGVTPPYDEIFFVGDQTGWAFKKCTQDALDPFLFRIGIFFDKEGTFKFGTSDGSWENMYKATVADAPYTSQSVEFVKGFDPDNKWKMSGSELNKAYKLCLDIRPGKERMMCRLFTPYDNLYLIGSACAAGWDLGNALPMTVDATDPNILTWKGHLDEGELKFSADKQSDWNGAWFLAPTANAAPDGRQQMIFVDKSDNAFKAQYIDVEIGGFDQKWVVTQPGEYTITINQLTETVTFKH